MKIAVGYFYQESTTFNPFVMDRKAFTIVEGEACKARLSATKVLADLGATVIPMVFANANSGGCVTQDAYNYISTKIIDSLKGQQVDGVWMHLHGSMEVDGFGSAEADLLKRIREVIPSDAPISIVVDLHANLHDDVPKLANIIRSYRTAPHVDQEECERITAEMLVDCIKSKNYIHPVFKRIPMITPGEKSTTNTEPMMSILVKAREYEQLDGIRLVNYLNGHAWTDRPNTSAAALVIPESDAYNELAEKVANELAEYAYAQREKFVFHQLTLGPDESLDRAISHVGKPVFITDSGDNTTGGAAGINTLMLRKLMERNLNGKKAVVAAVLDPAAYEKLAAHEIGDKVSVEVGIDYDSDSAPVLVEGTLKAKGDLMGYYSSKNDVTGHVCTVEMGDIDVVVANASDSFTTINHFTKAGLDVNDYDIAIIKQGYLFVELTAIASLHIMALTPGACNLIVENMEFHNLLRPMYPLDK